MTLNYVVDYAFKKLGADALPEGERYGYGKMNINTDIEPTTDEELLEVARTIGLEAGHEEVGVLKITPLQRAIDDGDVVLEGTIVDSE